MSVASRSRVVSSRMHSSRSSSAPGTAIASASNAPDAHALAARSCDPSANASCSSREIENSSARISAPSPSATVHSLGIVGFTIRHPSAEFHICSCVVGNGRDGLRTTHGARVIDSTPPAMMRSASPTATARLASLTASSPDPHKRLTVAPGMDTGSPASSTAMRPTLRLSSPAPLASPKYTSSIDAGSSEGWRSSRPRNAVAARSSGRTPESAPPSLPIGVRTASRMSASVSIDVTSPSWSDHQGPRTRRLRSGKRSAPRRRRIWPQMPGCTHRATTIATTPVPMM